MNPNCRQLAQPLGVDDHRPRGRPLSYRWAIRRDGPLGGAPGISWSELVQGTTGIFWAATASGEWDRAI